MHGAPLVLTEVMVSRSPEVAVAEGPDEDTTVQVTLSTAIMVLSSAGGDRLQLLFDPRVPPNGGLRERVEGGGTGGSGEGNGLGRKSSKDDSNGR